MVEAAGGCGQQGTPERNCILPCHLCQFRRNVAASADCLRTRILVHIPPTDYYLTQRLLESPAWKNPAEAAAMTRAYKTLRDLYADVRETFANQPGTTVRAKLLAPTLQALGGIKATTGGNFVTAIIMQNLKSQ